MIEAVNLTKRYEDNLLALDSLNLRVEPGEIYCLLGDSHSPYHQATALPVLASCLLKNACILRNSR